MSITRSILALIAVAAITVALGLLTMSMASAADPVTVTLKSFMEGNVNVVDVSITNSTSSNLSAEINASLPDGATLVGASPKAKVSGNIVTWMGTVSAGRTVVGYQYKFRADKGSTFVTVNYIGSTRGTAVSNSVTAAAAPLAQLAVATTKPVATLDIVPIPGSATVAEAITATLPSTGAAVAMFTSGLNNVSVGLPVVLQGGSTDEKSPAKTFTWTLSKPSASKSALNKTNTEIVKFTPDVAGTYKIDLVVGNEAGTSPMASVQVRAGTYVGVQAGGCAGCHSGKVTEWAETGHGKLFTRNIDGRDDPPSSHYREACIRCHTTGYVIGADNGGFADVQAETGWKFPSEASIQTGKGNWDAVPAKLKNVANVQCEACHGPAADHLAKQAPMATSLDVGVCNQCHNGGGHHTRGAEFENSKHSNADSRAWTYPVGPSRQACVRCHSGTGLISFLANPTEQAAWDNSPQNPTCAVCHDPHSDANPIQLRIVGKPVEANGITKDFGLSAICVECHNARTPASAAAASAATPHYSAAGEMLAGMGGVEYGQKIIDSPHVAIVGTSPMKDATGADLFMGQTPGACVACHMYPQPADAKDPEHFKVGNHSFNTVSPSGFQYTASCQACHPGAKTFADIKANGDYDGDGTVEASQAEIAGLLKALQGAIDSSGIKATDHHPYFDRSNVANWTVSQKNAIYNYLFVRGLAGSDGKAAAIHNMHRSVMLLQLSYKDLSGKDVPNAKILK